MVNSCSVYGCTSIYNKRDKTNYIPIFTEWIRKIQNKDLKVIKNSRVCINHFEVNDTKRFDIFKCANGDPDIKVPGKYLLLNVEYISNN